jgi:hypothetical protein
MELSNLTKLLPASYNYRTVKFGNNTPAIFSSVLSSRIDARFTAYLTLFLLLFDKYTENHQQHI